MKLKFQIKPTSSKAEMEGNEVIRFSGESEAYKRTATRVSEPVGLTPKGEPVVKFVTGIDPDKVQFYYWYNEEEKAEIKKQIEEALPALRVRYGGEEVLQDTNVYFWKENRDIYQIPVTITTKSQFFDTSNLEHTLLYLGIIGGAFINMIAPTKEFAERYRIPHYLMLETETDDEEYEEVSDSIEAIANLSSLVKDESGDGLFILCWTALYGTKGFGSLLKSTPKKDLISYLKMYIDGNLVDKHKKKCAKNFNEYYEKWKSTQLRPKLYAEAYIKGGEQFAVVVTKDKKYETSWGTLLGNTIEEAVEKISQKKFADDLKRLQEEVEKKWLM